jgi:hypothetical protein
MKEMKQSFSENGISLIVFADLSDEAPYLLQIEQDEETFKSKFCRCKHMYELAKLYEATDREAEAFAMAKQIIAKKVKISSSTIAVIKREMQELVNRINNKCLIKKQRQEKILETIHPEILLPP